MPGLLFRWSATFALLWFLTSCPALATPAPAWQTEGGHTKLLPVMVTAVPTVPLDGVNDAMVGGEAGAPGAYLMVV
jgi:hypothetical protein